MLIPFIFLGCGLAFGIVSMVKKRRGSLPLIIVSGALTIVLTGADLYGAVIGSIIGIVEKTNSSYSSSVAKYASIEYYIEGAEKSEIKYAYAGENETYCYGSDHDSTVIATIKKFQVTEIESKTSFAECGYVYYSISDSNTSYLYLSASYDSIKIYNNGFGGVTKFYSISVDQGKKLYNAMKTSYETKTAQIEKDIEAAKLLGTYEKFIEQMNLNVSNYWYYCENYKTRNDSSKEVLNLLKALNPTLSAQKDSRNYTPSDMLGADIIYGLKAGDYPSAGNRYISIDFDNCTIKVAYPFLNTYDESYTIYSSYVITSEESSNLKQNIANVIS